MSLVKVQGKNSKHKVRLYAISTCAWCKATKKFLKNHSIKYEYIDVDLCDKKVKDKIVDDILSRGGTLSYPTIIIDDEVLITGFREDELKEALEV
ncbi:MAG TPA: glutaredoxin family protein [archaeon]|nr:glutaredoxin family protein [archaeon]